MREVLTTDIQGEPVHKLYGSFVAFPQIKHLMAAKSYIA